MLTEKLNTIPSVHINLGLFLPVRLALSWAFGEYWEDVNF